MDPDAAFDRLRERLAPLARGVHLERDAFGDALVFVRRDLSHLDADALSDRLHAWCARDVQARLPGATAYVDFRGARPADGEEASLDVEAAWRDLEPTFRLDLRLPPPAAEDVDAFARLVPAFLALVEADGRPDDWRDVETGHAE